VEHNRNRSITRKAKRKENKQIKEEPTEDSIKTLPTYKTWMDLPTDGTKTLKYDNVTYMKGNPKHEQDLFAAMWPIKKKNYHARKRIKIEMENEKNIGEELDKKKGGGRTLQTLSLLICHKTRKQSKKKVEDAAAKKKVEEAAVDRKLDDHSQTVDCFVDNIPLLSHLRGYPNRLKKFLMS
jgi:hypothetical protein